MKLSELFEKGIELSVPRRGDFIHPMSNACFACALGTLVIGYYDDPGRAYAKWVEIMDGKTYVSYQQFTRQVVSGLGLGDWFTHPLTGKKGRLYSILEDLFEHDHWSREQILELLKENNL